MDFLVGCIVIPLAVVGTVIASVVIPLRLSRARSLRVLECLRSRLGDARISVERGCPTITGMVAGRCVLVRIEGEEGGNSVAVEVALRAVPGSWPEVTVRNGAIACDAFPALGKALGARSALVERRRTHERESRRPDEVLVTRCGTVRARDFGIDDLLMRGAELQLNLTLDRALPAALEMADAVDAVVADGFPDLPWGTPATSTSSLESLHAPA